MGQLRTGGGCSTPQSKRNYFPCPAACPSWGSQAHSAELLWEASANPHTATSQSSFAAAAPAKQLWKAATPVAALGCQVILKEEALCGHFPEQALALLTESLALRFTPNVHLFCGKCVKTSVNHELPPKHHGLPPKWDLQPYIRCNPGAYS